ncbi:CEGT-like protein [Mya arenaria]|uniref:ceramide glucosyltransferase n=1 Tax=Mya arenaria TaxID=6604 RepID=A0ABY7FNT0_MYAAR|nr:CEGT-like protein [Mya arenaria]
MESVDFLLFGLAILIFSGWCFNLPGISILKPLVGIDPNLFENLESFFKMKYPNFELLFCIQDEMDASRMIVQSLIDKYPKVGEMWESTLKSTTWRSVDEDTLVDMAVYMTPNVGLVHQMPYTCTRKGLASTYEKVYFGTQHAKMYLSANVLGINCAVGMSCLMRKPILEEAGGLHEFGQYLAEDFFIAQAFLDRGWRTKKGSIPFSKVDYLVCWCLNEISYPLLMLQSHWDPIITWRGRNFKLKWGGLVEELYVKQTV